MQLHPYLPHTRAHQHGTHLHGTQRVPVQDFARGQDVPAAMQQAQRRCLARLPSALLSTFVTQPSIAEVCTCCPGGQWASSLVSCNHRPVDAHGCVHEHGPLLQVVDFWAMNRDTASDGYLREVMSMHHSHDAIGKLIPQVECSASPQSLCCQPARNIPGQ